MVDLESGLMQSGRKGALQPITLAEYSQMRLVKKVTQEHIIDIDIVTFIDGSSECLYTLPQSYNQRHVCPCVCMSNMILTFTLVSSP